MNKRNKNKRKIIITFMLFMMIIGNQSLVTISEMNEDISFSFTLKETYGNSYAKLSGIYTPNLINGSLNSINIELMATEFSEHTGWSGVYTVIAVTITSIIIDFDFIDINGNIIKTDSVTKSTNQKFTSLNSPKNVSLNIIVPANAKYMDAVFFFAGTLSQLTDGSNERELETDYTSTSGILVSITQSIPATTHTSTSITISTSIPATTPIITSTTTSANISTTTSTLPSLTKTTESFTISFIIGSIVIIMYIKKLKKEPRS